MIDYPAAERLDLTEEVHGHAVADPYRWLEDRADPRTAAWRAGQGALFDRESQQWHWREELGARLTELVSFDHVTLPRPRPGRIFWASCGVGQEHPVLYVQEGDERVRELVDPMLVDPTGRTTLEAWHPSPGGTLVAYQLATGGTEESLLRVLDVASGEIVDGPVGRVRRSPVAWLPGGEGFFYVRRLHPDLVPPNERQYHRRVYLHRLGTDPDTDVLIFGDGRDKADYYGVTLSPDGRWLTVSVTAGTARGTDLWLADLDAAGPERPELRPVQTGIDARTVPYIRRGTTPDGEFCLLTERDAEYGRLAVSTPAGMAGKPWRDLLPEEQPTVLADFAVLDGDELDRPQLVVVRTRHAVSEMTVHDLTDGRQIGTVPLPGKGWVTHVVDRVAGGHEAWFSYTDFSTPKTVFRYDARTGEVEPWLKPASITIPKMETRHVTYTSADGTEVRMFVLSMAGVADRPRPTILTAYGGFGVPSSPAYNPMVPAWVEAGGVFAVAHIRGGGEEGERWHRAGMREHKQKGFDDFAAAADWLVDNGWTTRSQLGVYGQSNGGLLAGAALTQHPGKWAAVVSVAPLLDMVRYERFGMGPSWRTEYGTAADPVEFEWLLSYSPYHRVRADTPYPAVLLAVFDGDTRVDPLHARKLCAALQHASTSGRPVLLRDEADVGHSMRALSRGVAVVADILAFMAAQLGLGEIRADTA